MASKKSACPSAAPLKNLCGVAVNKALKFNPKAEDAIEVDFERKLLLGYQFYPWNALRVSQGILLMKLKPF